MCASAVERKVQNSIGISELGSWLIKELRQPLLFFLVAFMTHGTSSTPTIFSPLHATKLSRHDIVEILGSTAVLTIS